MATSFTTSTTPASVESPNFEEVVYHLLYDDVSALAWGSVPGVALCGHIFTTRDEGISNASLVLAEDCRTCHDRHLVNMLELALDGDQR